MVRFLTCSSLLLLVLPSLVYGKSTTISVLNGSASLELSAYPDGAVISDNIAVMINLTSTARNEKPDISNQIYMMENLHPTVSTPDTDITLRCDPQCDSSNREVNTRGNSSFTTFIVTLSWPVNMDIHRQYIPVTILIEFTDDKQLEVTHNVRDNRG